MKTAEFLSGFSYAKKELKKVTRITMLKRMVADNIQDLIPDDWQIEKGGSYGLRIIPKENRRVTVDQADNLAGKLAKAFRSEPNKNVQPDIIMFDFWIYPCAYGHTWLDDNREALNIEVTTANTEKCDFVMERKIQKIFTPTGYCKALKEKQYLS